MAAEWLLGAERFWMRPNGYWGTAEWCWVLLGGAWWLLSGCWVIAEPCWTMLGDVDCMLNDGWMTAEWLLDGCWLPARHRHWAYVKHMHAICQGPRRCEATPSQMQCICQNKMQVPTRGGWGSSQTHDSDVIHYIYIYIYIEREREICLLVWCLSDVDPMLVRFRLDDLEDFSYVWWFLC